MYIIAHNDEIYVLTTSIYICKLFTLMRYEVIDVWYFKGIFLYGEHHFCQANKIKLHEKQKIMIQANLI